MQPIRDPPHTGLVRAERTDRGRIGRISYWARVKIDLASQSTAGQRSCYGRPECSLYV